MGMLDNLMGGAYRVMKKNSKTKLAGDIGQQEHTRVCIRTKFPNFAPL